MEIQILINQLAVLFLLMSVGFIVGKSKAVTSEVTKVISKFIMFFTFPSTILNSILQSETSTNIVDTLVFLFASIITIIIAALITKPLLSLLRVKKEDRGVMAYLSIFGNVGFMGFPVALALFGPAAAYYIALNNIVVSALMFSMGIIMIAGKGEKINLKPLINPTLIISVLAIPISLFDISFPFILSQSLSLTGAITVPASMFIIGITLSSVPLKSLISEWKVYPITAIKLIVLPIIIWLIARIFISDELMLGILVLLAAMPSAAMVAIFAIQYKANDKLASAGVFLTTVLCAVTVPLLVYLLLM